MTATLLSPLADLIDGPGGDQPVWGIDPSTYRFAIGVIRPEDGAVGNADTFERGDGWAVGSWSLPRDDMGPRRWYGIYRRLREVFTTLAFATGEPVFVMVETPFSYPGKGRNSVHPESFYVVSAAYVALGEVLACPIDDVGPSEWKKPALGEGHGHAKKGEILAWARSDLGYSGECEKCGNVPGGSPEHHCPKPRPAHDEADALGIGVAAARRLARYGHTVEVTP